MRNPNRPVIKWFRSKMQPLEYVYKNYPGFAPPNLNDQQYYIINARSSQQGQDKCDFVSIVSVTIVCIAKGPNFGFEDSDAMSDEVLSLIDSDISITLDAGFYANALFVADISNDEGLNDETNTFRTLVTYNLTVTQTT